MNAPVPTGRREKSCPIVCTAVGETGASGESATILRNGAYGRLNPVLPGGEDDLAPGLRLGVRHQRGEKEQQDRDGRGHGRLLTRRAGASRRRLRSRR